MFCRGSSAQSVGGGPSLWQPRVGPYSGQIHRLSKEPQMMHSEPQDGRLRGDSQLLCSETTVAHNKPQTSGTCQKLGNDAHTSWDAPAVPHKNTPLPGVGFIFRKALA